MLLALGGDGRNGNREESAEKTERVGRETESAVKILEELLIFGYRKNASDIHMEPWEDRFVIRMRIDGMMTMVREFDKSMYQPLVTRAKVISGMDIAKKRVPQDGHFRETIEGIRLDMRTSVIPTIFGEKMVLRFLDRKTEIDHCGTFGMNEENYKKMIQILRSPGGILYLTGPTGCGKTTTLYLILEYLKLPAGNLHRKPFFPFIPDPEAFLDPRPFARILKRPVPFRKNRTQAPFRIH
jgi:type IV pilus assembly protein PilB